MVRGTVDVYAGYVLHEPRTRDTARRRSVRLTSRGLRTDVDVPHACTNPNHTEKLVYLRSNQGSNGPSPHTPSAAPPCRYASCSVGAHAKIGTRRHDIRRSSHAPRAPRHEIGTRSARDRHATRRTPNTTHAQHDARPTRAHTLASSWMACSRSCRFWYTTRSAPTIVATTLSSPSRPSTEAWCATSSSLVGMSIP